MNSRNYGIRKAVIIVALLLSFAVQVVVLPLMGRQTVAVFPEAAGMSLPALIWSIAVICCIQAILLISLRLLKSSETPAGVTGWVVAMLIATVVGIGLLLGGHIVLSGLGTYPPLVFLTVWALIAAGTILLLKLVKTLWQNHIKVGHTSSKAFQTL